jgi:hypothetical protein
MSSASLSVLLVCNGRILRHRGKFGNMLYSCLHVRHFSDGNQTMCPFKKKSWPPIMPKQRADPNAGQGHKVSRLT